MPKKLSQEQVISKARIKHKNLYNYSKSVYVNMQTPWIVTCSKHGDFLVKPYKHINRGDGCPKCGVESRATKRRYTIQEFIELAKIVHSDTYDYSKFIYKNSQTKGIIICPKHGEFLQIPASHLQGKGCEKCAYEIKGRNSLKTLDAFITGSNIVHSNRYNYSKFIYTDSHTKSVIICPIHGEFKMRPNSHLNGQGCPSCARIESKGEKELREWIKTMYPDADKFPHILKRPDIKDRGLEIDVYIPSIKFGIEYDGSFWHSVARGGTIRRKEKGYRAKLLGIHLIHIVDEDWHYYKNRIKKYILRQIEKRDGETFKAPTYKLR